MSQLYQFKEDDAFRFARMFGHKVQIKGRELIFMKCPFCGETTNKKNKFSINLDTGQYNCFRASCGKHGNMITLSQEFPNFSLGAADEYYRADAYKWKNFGKIQHKKPQISLVDYFKNRGIPEDIVEKYHLYIKEGTDDIITFPFEDETGDVRFIKYRNMNFTKGESYGNKEWCETDCKTILFGMHQCNLDNKTLIMTEGQIDSMSVAAAGFENAVSVPTGKNGFSWVPHCWDWLQNFEKLIIFGDHENNEITLLDGMHNRFRGQILHVREEDYLDCKDANEILQRYGTSQIAKCISNAVVDLPKQIVWLADVPSTDPTKTMKLPTSISMVDTMLLGGLPFGGVTIIAGKRGEGKSTLASQICANAIKFGHIVFAYSGELANDRFQYWVDMQIAGPDYLVPKLNAFGGAEWAVKEDSREKIHKWYQNKFLVYNSNILDDEESQLLDIVESAIIQQGADVILLDNLMTALDLDASIESDKYERQSRFVKKVTRLAVRYNVLIILVAHNRKNSEGGDSNDDVSGSSDITNLAMVTLGYRKATQKERKNHPEYNDNTRFLTIMKNRLYGKISMSGFEVHYDESSRRITCEGDDVRVPFGWEKEDFKEVTQETV